MEKPLPRPLPTDYWTSIMFRSGIKTPSNAKYGVATHVDSVKFSYKKSLFAMKSRREPDFKFQKITLESIENRRKDD